MAAAPPDLLDEIGAGAAGFQQLLADHGTRAVEVEAHGAVA